MHFYIESSVDRTICSLQPESHISPGTARQHCQQHRKHVRVRLSDIYSGEVEVLQMPVLRRFDLSGEWTPCVYDMPSRM
jgi:hypothetical protein